ncbi:hypothetical protein ACHAO9_009298 [Fusarium lateritium]
MRLSTSILACLGGYVAQASCPYAEQHKSLERRSHNQVTESVTNDKKGVFYLNRIAPSSSLLYIANADGSDAKPLMKNKTADFDFHPSWSPDGKGIVFSRERRADGQSDIYRVKPDGSSVQTLVQTDSFEDAGVLSPDGQWIAFSSDRNTEWTGHSNGTGWEHTQTLSIYIIRLNGTDFRLVASKPGYALGTPQWSPDGQRILYNMISTEDRVVSEELSSQCGLLMVLKSPSALAFGSSIDAESETPLGLRILDMVTGATNNLTSGWDNTPSWSPDGERIAFTRQVNGTAEYGSRWYENRFDIMTIRPDGSDLQQVTDSPANDAHAVWSYEGRILWSSGMYGFRDESSQYENTFQRYGQIMVMNEDGTRKLMLTDSMWEDSMPMYVPRSKK